MENVITQSEGRDFVKGMRAVEYGLQFVRSKAPDVLEKLNITGGESFAFIKNNETGELLITLDLLYLNGVSKNKNGVYIVPSGLGKHVLPGFDPTPSNDEIVQIASDRRTIITLATIEEAGHALYAETIGIGDNYSKRASSLAAYDAQPEEMFSLFLQLEYLRGLQSDTVTKKNLENRLRNAVLRVTKNSKLDSILDKYISQDDLSDAEQFALAIIRGQDYTSQTVPYSLKDTVQTIRDLGVEEISSFGDTILGDFEWSIKLPSTSIEKGLSTEFSIITHPYKAEFEVVIQGYNYCYRVEFVGDSLSIDEIRNEDLGSKDPKRYKTKFHPQLKKLIEEGIEIFEGLSAIASDSQVYVSINGKPVKIIQPVSAEVIQKLKMLPNHLAPEEVITPLNDDKIETPTVCVVSPDYIMHLVSEKNVLRE